MIIYFLMLAGAVALVISVWQQVRPWTSPMAASAKFGRSVSIGFGVSVSIFCLFAILDLWSGPNAIASWNLQSVLASFCFVLPLGVIATIGSYINFGVMDKLRAQVTKLKDKRRL